MPTPELIRERARVVAEAVRVSEHIYPNGAPEPNTMSASLLVLQEAASEAEQARSDDKVAAWNEVFRIYYMFEDNGVNINAAFEEQMETVLPNWGMNTAFNSWAADHRDFIVPPIAFNGLIYDDIQFEATANSPEERGITSYLNNFRDIEVTPLLQRALAGDVEALQNLDQRIIDMYNVVFQKLLIMEHVINQVQYARNSSDPSKYPFVQSSRDDGRSIYWELLVDARYDYGELYTQLYPLVFAGIQGQINQDPTLSYVEAYVRWLGVISGHLNSDEFKEIARKLNEEGSEALNSVEVTQLTQAAWNALGYGDTHI